MTDSGLQSWAEGLSARERVREIATTLTQQRSVNWVKEEAGISSWQTAKEELEMLVEFGQLRAVEGERGDTRYAPNYQRRYFDELAALINEHTRSNCTTTREHSIPRETNCRIPPCPRRCCSSQTGPTSTGDSCSRGCTSCWGRRAGTGTVRPGQPRSRPYRLAGRALSRPGGDCRTPRRVPRATEESPARSAPRRGCVTVTETGMNG
jgi:hypothetical protein